MQHYHIESDRIPEYINKLEDTHAKSERTNNPITDATLVIIATNTMLSTDELTRANEYWEEIDVGQHMWKKRNTTYLAEAKKATIEKKANGGKEQFGSVNSATQQPAPTQPCRYPGSPVRYAQTMSL